MIETISKLIAVILASNPAYTLVFLVCFLVIFALPSIMNYMALNNIVNKLDNRLEDMAKELKASIDKVADQHNSLVDFVLKNLKVKKKR